MYWTGKYFACADGWLLGGICPIDELDVPEVILPPEIINATSDVTVHKDGWVEFDTKHGRLHWKASKEKAIKDINRVIPCVDDLYHACTLPLTQMDQAAGRLWRKKRDSRIAILHKSETGIAVAFKIKSENTYFVDFRISESSLDHQINEPIIGLDMGFIVRLSQAINLGRTPARVELWLHKEDALARAFVIRMPNKPHIGVQMPLHVDC